MLSKGYAPSLQMSMRFSYFWRRTCRKMLILDASIRRSLTVECFICFPPKFFAVMFRHWQHLVTVHDLRQKKTLSLNLTKEPLLPKSKQIYKTLALSTQETHTHLPTYTTLSVSSSNATRVHRQGRICHKCSEKLSRRLLWLFLVCQLDMSGAAQGGIWRDCTSLTGGLISGFLASCSEQQERVESFPRWFCVAHLIDFLFWFEDTKISVLSSLK